MKTSAVTIRIEPDLQKLLDKVCKQSGRTRSDVVHDSLKRQLSIIRFEQQAQIREEFPALITMTPSQMRDWASSPFAGENRKRGEARTSARDALRRVMALKEKPMAEWTESDYDDAVKAIAFVKRMSEVEQGDPIVIEGCEDPSERDASLRDWGHWTDAADLPTADSVAARLRRIADAPPAKRAARGWTGKSFDTAIALLSALAPIHADSASSRVYRTQWRGGRNACRSVLCARLAHRRASTCDLIAVN